MNMRRINCEDKMKKKIYAWKKRRRRKNVI
jgi:hypothetical protein